jgi:hypothetical protein
MRGCAGRRGIAGGRALLEEPSVLPGGLAPGLLPTLDDPGPSSTSSTRTRRAPHR